jgi:hypothetical protein
MPLSYISVLASLLNFFAAIVDQIMSPNIKIKRSLNGKIND